MIITNLKGGLGNQMFQYAAGLALAEKHNVELKCDLSFLNKSQSTADFTKRSFELDVFKISSTAASTNEVNEFKKVTKQLPYRFMRKFFPRFITTKVYNYEYLRFDPAFLQLGDHVYIDGYFQSEKY